MLEKVFLIGEQPLITETGTYIPFLILLSYLVASFASYTTLNLVGYISKTHNRMYQRLCHYAGAFSMGAGIWSMHFIGMLAYKMDMVVNYDPVITALSMFPALIISYFVLQIVKKGKLGAFRLIVSSILLGAGICGMHYTGMAAMEMDGDILYKPGLFMASVLIAVLASGAALLIMFVLTYRITKYRFALKILAALIMGFAICGMHYTGMAATVFIPWADCRYDPDQSYMTLALSIAAISAVILGLVFALVFHSESLDTQGKRQLSFPVKTLTLAVIFSIVSLLWVGVNGYSAYLSLTFKLESAAGMNKLANQILYLDNARTYDARMAVRTGEPKWEALYKQHQAQIIEAEQIMAVKYPDHDEEGGYVDVIRDAEIVLEEIELQDLAFVRQGNLHDGQHAMSGDRYTQAKNNKSLGLHEFYEEGQAVAHAQLHVLAQSMYYALYPVALSLMFLVAIWFFALRNIRNWHVELLLARNTLNDEATYLTAIMDNMMQAVITIDTKGIIKTCNKWGEWIFGYQAAELVGQNVNMLMPEPYHSEHDGYLKNYTKTGESVVMDGNRAVEGKRKGGNVFPLSLSITDVSVDNEKIFVGLLSDISQEKEAEKERDELMRFPEQNPFPVLRFNYADLSLSYKNKPSDVLFHLWDYKDQSDLPLILKSALQKAVDTNQQQEIEVEADSRTFFFHIVPIPDHGYINIYSVDITTLKDIERALGVSKKEAERASEAKSDFLANMSHELRTPLNSILGMTRMFVEDEDISEDNRSMATTVHKSATNLLEIVNDILDISKIESGNMVLENIGFDLKNMVASVMESMAPIASAKGVSLNYQYEQGEVPYCLGDPLRVGRILTNLISNAVKYTNTGNVDVVFDSTEQSPETVEIKTFEIDAGNVEVQVESKVLNEGKVEILCTVKDTGVGIAEDQLSHIFEKFTQADVSTTRKYGGTGLGLAITKELVEMMDGTIGVESEVGKGSTFWFKIPFDITDQVEERTRTNRLVKKSTQDSKTRLPFDKVRILIAEDHLLNQDFISRLLRRMGLKHIDIVGDGSLAVNAFEDKDYDLILMDCHMPEKNGYKATADIRKSKKKTGKDIPIVALTADAMRGTREKCLKAGMNEYVSKPIDSDELKDVLEQWIIFPEEESLQSKIKGSKNSDAPVDISLLESYADTPDDVKNFISVFLKQSEESIKIIAEHCVEGDSKAWVDAAHKLKGGSGMVGAKKLQELCEKAQEMADVPAGERGIILKKIWKEYGVVKDYLKTFLS